LENAADRLAKQLLGMATDPKLPPAVKLAALKDALDRAGMTPRQALDLQHSLEPTGFQELLEGIGRISVDDPAYGPDWPELNDEDILEGEVVEDDPYADNPLDPETGRVHCAECDGPFPAELPPNLTKFPRVCRDCREAARAERTEDRELDTKIGAPTGSRPPVDPMRPRARPQPPESSNAPPPGTSEFGPPPRTNPRYPTEPKRRFA
jgi:hypothetical protein